LSKPTSSHAYGIGIIAMIVGLAIGISYYQLYYLPELTAKPKIAEAILNPKEETIINMIKGSSSPDQQDNFVPKLVHIQLEIDNKVIWDNIDDTPHTVTPDSGHEYTDKYSGKFGSVGVIKPGEKYEFLFTAPEVEIDYHCEPHPWMTGKLIITKARF
jgi:plastocyanin